MTSKILGCLLLFSVCLNFGMAQSYFNRPGAGEKLLSLERVGDMLHVTIGDGQSYPVTVVMNSDNARAFARSVNEQAELLDSGLPAAPKTVKATSDELERLQSELQETRSRLEQCQQQRDARTREAEIQEKMRKVRSDNPFESR